MNTEDFKNAVLEGIPDELPEPKPYDRNINHAPKRKDVLSKEEKKLALKNALRYFDKKHHTVLAKEFADELERFGRIYMHRFRPDYEIHARS
ncbi:MAG: urocanate hydratase, partial [bacterium]